MLIIIYLYIVCRLVTQVVSDHWLAYRNYRLDIVGDRMETLPTTTKPGHGQFSLQRLQVEFDQIFLTAAKRILSSHRFGSSFCLLFIYFVFVGLFIFWGKNIIFLKRSAPFFSLPIMNEYFLLLDTHWNKHKSAIKSSQVFFANWFPHSVRFLTKDWKLVVISQIIR